MIDLFDSADRKRIASFISNEKSRLQYNAEIQQILDGSLSGLLDAKMKEDLGAKSYLSAQSRKAPINVLQKIIDKLTKIYSQPVIRTVQNGNNQDAELLAWYENILKVNKKFGKNNYKFNAFLYSIIQIGLKDGKPGEFTKIPFIRSIPNHQFLAMNASRFDNSSADVIIVCMEKRKRVDGTTQEVYYVYTDIQFIIMDERGDIIKDLMLEHEMDGLNSYGVKPFSYVNDSDDNAMPAIQTDNKDMALLIPMLLTDLNYAVKYQAFSVFVAINLDDKQVELSPNSIISFQTNAGDERQASFDSIKPTIDIAQTLSLASSEMALWLSTKGIRPGQMAQIGADQLASGISKMIDESDTYESIKKQIQVYQEFETNFWEVLLKEIHPKWVAAGVVENRTIFSPEARVVTKFTEPAPMQTRREKIGELVDELEAGFTSRARAIRTLNAGLTEEEVEKLMEEIDEEKPAIVPAAVPRMEQSEQELEDDDGEQGNPAEN